MIDRERILTTLFDVGRGVQWGTPAQGFVTSERRFKHWTDCPGQPALYQVEHDDDFDQRTRLPYLVTMNVKWVVYQNLGRDPDSVPQTLNNQILDALQAALTPDILSPAYTLGGLVQHVWIAGTVFRDSGDLDGQGVMVVPIKLLVPSGD